jgi:hypothetical protein
VKRDEAATPAPVDGNDWAPAPRPRRSKKLRVIDALQLPQDWELLPGVPATRAECVDGPRPCAYVSCRHHLWLRLQSENPGNPKAGKQGATTFKPSSMQSCALDVADKGATFDEIGRYLGCDSTRARQIAAAAIDKLRAAGVDVAEMMELL